jgi:Family of unknown function (DUF6090)
MAEQEVIKHTKKVYKIWRSKEHSFWSKTKEFLVEIFIIVFAITLSIWFHNWSEHRHEQAEVKKFLIGLREDLRNDIAEMTADSKSYQIQSNAFKYIISIKLRDTLRFDSLSKYSTFLFNTTGLVPNSGRFEGFKSSGKMAKIENDSLQNEIMDLYQENIPSLLNATNSYIERKKQFFNYVQVNRKRITDSTSNFLTILAKDEAQNICSGLTFTDEIIQRYNNCIIKMQSINRIIEAEYGLAAGK